MSITWTRESVLRLAPDASSAKSGQDLAAPRKWAGFNSAGTAIWGLCQGSGSKPYQTIVDLSEPAFKCSCPSRKFPCKHGLGLLLMYASDAASFAAADVPAWVNEWLTGRADRAAKKAEAATKPPAPVDAEAQAARREKRMDRITAGLASLRTWVDDLVRQGIAAVPSRGYGFFDEPARRMVDAQAPGVARMIQTLGETAHGGAGWHSPFLTQLGSLHTLLRAAEKLDQLPPETRDDVMAAVGVSIKEDEVILRTPVADTWQVVTQEIEVEDRLRVQRTWLIGVATRRPALLLHFAHGTGPLDASFVAGTEFAGEVCFFPGNGVRAAVKSRQPGNAVTTLAGDDSLDALCDAYSSLLANQPWLGPVVFPLRQVRLALQGSEWSVIDGRSQRLHVRGSLAARWRVLAMSGGHPVDLVVRFDGEAVEPLAVISDGRYVVAGNPAQGEAALA